MVTIIKPGDKIICHSEIWVKRHCVRTNMGGSTFYYRRKKYTTSDLSLYGPGMLNAMIGKTLTVTCVEGYDMGFSVEETDYVVPTWLVKKVIKREE